MNRRTEGSDEEIVDPDVEIVDSHHHLWYRPPTVRYLLDEYVEDAGRGHRITASVYIETQEMARVDGPEHLRPLGEIEFANGVGAMAASGLFGPCRVAAAIVGYADLRMGDSVAEVLDRSIALAPERYRGIRQIAIEHPSEEPFRYMTHRPPAGVLEHPQFRAGLRQLSRRGLVFDTAVFHQQLPELAALADEFPDTTVVLNHAGLAMGMGAGPEGRHEIWAEWRERMLAIAQRPNVMCKVGGLGLPFWGFGFESRPDRITSAEAADAWRPYVETVIEAFGVDRTMMESNYPPDSRSCGFVPLWNGLKLITQKASDAEKAALYSGTARRVYRIPQVGG